MMADGSETVKLHVGGITTDVNEQNLADFFNHKMKKMNVGVGGPGNSVLAVRCNHEKSYASVEVCMEEVTLHCSCILTPP